jgi:hypothetical protein
MRSIFLLPLLFAGIAHAHPVQVINPSFENPVLTPGLYTNYTKDPAQNIPGWTTSSGVVGVQNSIGSYDSAIADGANFAFDDGGFLSQTIGTLQPGTYKLTVAIGLRTDKSFAGGSLQLLAGDKVLQTFPLTAPKPGPFQDEALTYNAAASDSNIGAPLTIKFVSDGPTIDFDNVRFDFEPATPMTTIHSVSVDSPLMIASPGINANGDTWAPAWTKDGTVYSPANDTDGFSMVHSSNINFNRIDGAAPEALTGFTVNSMLAYGSGSGKGPDNCTWKSGGCLALDSVLYWTIARHKYGEDSGDPLKRQPGHDGSIIKSTDNGIHWTRSAQENYDHPMFPGSRFACGYFVNYGQDGHLPTVDHNDKWVYSMSNNGFWDNGDDVILGRVLRSKIANLDAKDWQFYTGGDGLSDSSWDPSFDKAAKIIDDKDHCGETGAVYLPKFKCYLMIEWFYPDGGGKLPNAHTHTRWNFLTAEHPWGPWKSIATHDFTPQGYYCPNICPKYTSADGTRMIVYCAGDWTHPVYRLTLVPISLQ